MSLSASGGASIRPMSLGTAACSVRVIDREYLTACLHDLRGDVVGEITRAAPDNAGWRD
jgi:hypothetical protein